MSNNIDNEQEGVVNDDAGASVVSEEMGDAQLAVSKSFQIMTYHVHIHFAPETIYELTTLDYSLSSIYCTIYF